MPIKLHKSQKFLYICLFFIAGIFFSSILNLSYIFYIILFFLIIIISIIKNFKLCLLLLCCLSFYLGIQRLEQSYISENNYYNQQTNFQGVVTKEPDIRQSNTKLTIKSDQFKGLVLVNTSHYPEYNYGDLLNITCYIKKPEPVEDFSYDKYLARYNIYSICSRPYIQLIDQNQGNIFLASIYKFKNYLKARIEKIWVLPTSSFMAGILLGLKKELPEKIAQYFKDTGTIHILVISGLHVLIISSLISASLKHLYIPRPKKIYFMALILFSFVILTGAAPSVTRATFMALVVLLAEKVGRPKQTFNVLILVATIMLIINPKILIFDMGFQLSFLATIGLVYLSDKVEKILFFIPKLLGTRSLLAASLSAIILTNPLILVQFQKFSTIAPLANLIIVPFIPIIMMAGLFILGISVLSIKAATILGWGVMLIVNFLVSTAKWLGSFEWASIEVSEVGWIYIIAFYAGVYILIRRINKIKGDNPRV